jgi:hypothetical protein
MDLFVGSVAGMQLNYRLMFFKLILIVWIGTAMDTTSTSTVSCHPSALNQLKTRAKYMALVDDSAINSRQFRPKTIPLSTLSSDETKRYFESRADTESDDTDREGEETGAEGSQSSEAPMDLIRELNRRRLQYQQRADYQRQQQQRPHRQLAYRPAMSKKALSLFAHWKPSHYTSNEDNSFASDMISAVARGHSRPMGGPLRWGRR